MRDRDYAIALGALLATTTLTATPLYAATPAPQFATIDANGVDLATGLPYLDLDEGGIGSGPGRVEMRRIFGPAIFSYLDMAMADYIQESGICT